MNQPRKSASVSRSYQPIHSNWNSVSINWCLTNGKLTSLPFSGYVFPADFKASPYLNLDSINAIDDQGLPRPLPPFAAIRDAHKQAHYEPLSVYKIELPERYVAQSDNTSVAAPQEAVARMRSEVLTMKRRSGGVMCTQILQWVSVEVECKTPQTSSPSMHLWAFLQPAKIGGNTEILAADSQLVPDDHPRSGWGEYVIAAGGKSGIRRTWTKGVMKEEPVPSGDLVVEQISTSRFRFRLKLSIRNDGTPGDMARHKAQKGPARPLDDYEAGCWLKVWVRDPAVEWGMDPADDETNSLAERMDQMDPTSQPVSLMELANTFVGAHGFLRGRLMYDPTGKGDLGKSGPIYAMLFTPEVMGDLVKLDKILHPKDKSAAKELGSIVAVSSLTLVLAYALRRALEHWKGKTPETRPAGLPEDLPWPQWDHREKADFFVKLLESFDVASLLAAYAVDGFEHLAPVEVVASTGASNPNLVKLLAAVYGQIFDMALAQSPLHYKEFMLKRLEAREKVLEERIKWNQKEASDLKADAAGKVEQAKARNEALEKIRKQKALGLFAPSSRTKVTVDKEAITLNFMIVEGTATKTFPAPAGAPLPIAGIPLIWHLDLSATGSLGVNLRMVPDKEGEELDVFLEFTGSGKATATFGINALWSGLGTPEALAHAEVLKTDWKRKTKKSSATDEQQDEAERQEYASNKQALREMREGAVQNPPDADFKLLRLLKELNQAVRLNASVTAALDLQAGVGFKFHVNSKTGDRKWSFFGGGAKGISAVLKGDLSASLQASLLSFDYPIASMPEIGTLSVAAVSANLNGTLLGKPFPGPQWAYKWGKGELSEKIRQEEGKEFLVWGRAKPLILTYTDMETPDVKFNLVRDTNSATGVLADLPKEASVTEQKGTGGVIKIQLQLSSLAATIAPHVVAVGGWALDEGVGKVAGQDAVTKASPGRVFLEELTRAEGSAALLLHGKDLVPTNRYSKPITVFCPRVLEQSLAVRSGRLLVALTLGYFEDVVLWVQLREYNLAIDSVLPNQGKEWVSIPLQGNKAIEKGRQSLLQIALNQLSFPRWKEDVWEIYPVLSLVPHECGIINKKWFPRNMEDTERFVRVKT